MIEIAYIKTGYKRTELNKYIEHEDYYELIITSPKYGIFNVLFDKEDLEKVQKYGWSINMCINKKTTNIQKFYAGASIGYKDDNGKYKQKGIMMHRYLTDAPKGMVVDHINHNECDNRKSNLRICTQSQNLMNYVEKPCTNTSGHIGVCWDKSCDKWVAYLGINRKHISLGYYDDFNDAVVARIEGEKQWYGEYRSEK